MISDSEEIYHYGVKGMRWGVRKDDSGALSGVSRKTNRDAKKDAEEFTRAKMFYGKGAGTRRKLIKNTVDAKSSRDPLYKKAFDHHVSATDMSKRATQAKSERRRRNVGESGARTVRGVRHTLNGNSQLATASAALLAGGILYARSTGIDRTVASAARTRYEDLRRNRANTKTAQDFLRSMGM